MVGVVNVQTIPPMNNSRFGEYSSGGVPASPPLFLFRLGFIIPAILFPGVVFEH